MHTSQTETQQQTAIPIQTSKPASSRWFTFLHALLFVTGFSLVFILGWGGAATVFGQLFAVYKTFISQIGGVIVILFGLSTLGLLKMPWAYYRDTRYDWSRLGLRSGWAASPIMGAIFAAGWTPCIGTTLGAILTLGYNAENAGQAMVLTSGYALGMGIPFLLLGLGFDRAYQFLSRFRKHMRTIQIVNGLFLVAIGLILLLGKMTLISIFLQKNGWYLDLSWAGSGPPTYLIAMAAGLLSFLSPCVLPLVPAYLGYLSGRAKLPPTDSVSV